jgi:hypothetical protein
MRFIPSLLALSLLAIGVSTAEAKSITKAQADMCRWGSQVAHNAQKSKLSGKTLYSTRRALQERKFSKPWMKKMAMGITEQTFASRSRVSPKAVEKTYYQGCVRHEMASR